MVKRYFLIFKDSSSNTAVCSFYTSGQSHLECDSKADVAISSFDSISKCGLESIICTYNYATFNNPCKEDCNVCDKGIYEMMCEEYVRKVVTIVPAPIEEFVSPENDVVYTDYFGGTLIGIICNKTGSPSFSHIKSLYKHQSR